MRPEEQRQTAIARVDGRWWVAIDNQSHGPYTVSEIAEQVRRGWIDSNALVCPVAGSEWRVIAQVPQFSLLFPTRSSASGYAYPIFSPDLPWPANGICFYSFVVSPILCVLSVLVAIASPPSFQESSPYFAFELLIQLTDAMFGLAATIALIWGSIQMRCLRRSGAMTVLVTLIAYIIYSAAWTLVAIVLLFAALQGAGNYGGSDGGGGLAIFASLVSMINFATEILMAVWLYMNVDKLPWRRDSYEARG